MLVRRQGHLWGVGVRIDWEWLWRRPSETPPRARRWLTLQRATEAPMNRGTRHGGSYKCVRNRTEMSKPSHGVRARVAISSRIQRILVEVSEANMLGQMRPRSAGR